MSPAPKSQARGSVRITPVVRSAQATRRLQDSLRRLGADQTVIDAVAKANPVR